MAPLIGKCCNFFDAEVVYLEGPRQWQPLYIVAFGSTYLSCIGS